MKGSVKIKTIQFYEISHYYRRWLIIGEIAEFKKKFKQGNSVARDLPRTGSETNTTIFVIYIFWI